MITAIIVLGAICVFLIACVLVLIFALKQSYDELRDASALNPVEIVRGEWDEW